VLCHAFQVSLGLNADADTVLPLLLVRMRLRRDIIAVIEESRDKWCVQHFGTAKGNSPFKVSVNSRKVVAKLQIR
jgi:hypothetical protein